MAIVVTLNVPNNSLALFSQFNGTAVASGGTGPYTYSDNGTLPPSVTIDAATGVMSGELTQVGIFNTTITATDSLAATGTASFSTLVGAVPPSTQRVRAKWQKDDCIQIGRQMARVMFDSVNNSDFTATPVGDSNQVLGPVKSLLYNLKIFGFEGGTNGSQGLSLDVVSPSTLQRVSIGVPADLLGSATSFIADAYISGACPFYCDDVDSVQIVMNSAPSGGRPSSIKGVFFFANFEIPPFTLSCVDNLTD